MEKLSGLIFGRAKPQEAKPERHPGQVALENLVGREIIVKGIENGKPKTYRDTLAYLPGKEFFYLGTPLGHHIIHYDMTKNPDSVKKWGEYAYRMFRVHSIELADGTTIYVDDAVPYDASDKSLADNAA